MSRCQRDLSALGAPAVTKEVELDYEPVAVHAVVNADDDVDPARAQVWSGTTELRGLPFQFADRNGRGRVIRLEAGKPVGISVEPPRPARTVTFAHRTRDPSGPGLVPIGRVNASYAFIYADGARERVAIREGFEIAPVWAGQRQHWGARPSLAVPDQRDTLPARFEGAFSDAGERQTEIVMAGTWDACCGKLGGGLRSGWRYYLWSWVNPHPDRFIARIELDAGEAVVEVGALCLGYADEHPLRPEPARVVIADVPAGFTGRAGDLEIRVDRGTAGYTFPVPAPATAIDPLASWGDDGGEVSRVYARVSATQSGTVAIADKGRPILEERWRDLRTGRAKARSVRVVDNGRNWVRTTIVDDRTGRPLPCRVHFSSPEGVPFQPYGHPHHVNGDLSSWHIDVGADVRLGRTTYAYVDGACEGWLPRGKVHAQVSRGFEYAPINELITIDDDTRELTVRIKQVHDPARDGWYSGDSHVHFVSSFGGLREAAAEGVSVVNLLLSQWGSLYTNTEEFLGRPVTSDDGRTILYAAQENRQHFLGHLSLLGLKESVLPWCTDGPAEAEMGGGLETTLSDWADRCHAQGGTVVVPHFPGPLGEAATLIATGRADAVEFLEHQERAFPEYYRYLNAGFRVPVAGGTDKMSNDVPIGLSRSYVRLREGEGLTFEAWCAALRAGRSYMSSGPLLEFHVDDAGIGDTVRLPDHGGTVTVQARARSIFPMFRMELVHCGRVIASSENPVGARELHFTESVWVDSPGWLCLRVGGGGPDHLTRHRDEWQRAIMAHTSPIYLACGERARMSDREALAYTLGLVERGRSYVTGLASLDRGHDVLHHHGGDHQEFLVAPFDQARRTLEHRLRLLGER